MSNINLIKEQILNTNNERNNGNKILIDEMNKAFNNIHNEV